MSSRRLLTILALSAGSRICNTFTSPPRPASIGPSVRSTHPSSALTGDEEMATESEMSSLLRPSHRIEPVPLRIGHGFDIHRMVPRSEARQPVVIGGVEIVHENQKWTDKEGKYSGKPNSIRMVQLGVQAHSDGDVIYHSVVDAIFGALTLPDIGQVFQDTDPRWKGCDSSKFMEHAYKVLEYYGYRIGNIDVTLILEKPKVARFKPRMKANIVRLLNTTEGRVNVKARTHEKVDSAGELRSLSCHVVVMLEKVERDKEARPATSLIL